MKFFGLLLGLSGFTPAPLSYLCPPTIETSAKVEAPALGPFTAQARSSRHRFEALGMSDGGREYVIKPQDSRTLEDGRTVWIYHFDADQAPMMFCRYTSTTMELLQKLSSKIRQCEVTDGEAELHCSSKPASRPAKPKLPTLKEGESSPF